MRTRWFKKQLDSLPSETYTKTQLIISQLKVMIFQITPILSALALSAAFSLTLWTRPILIQVTPLQIAQIAALGLWYTFVPIMMTVSCVLLGIHCLNRIHDSRGFKSIQTQARFWTSYSQTLKKNREIQAPTSRPDKLDLNIQYNLLMTEKVLKNQLAHGNKNHRRIVIKNYETRDVFILGSFTGGRYPRGLNVTTFGNLFGNLGPGLDFARSNLLRIIMEAIKNNNLENIQEIHFSTGLSPDVADLKQVEEALLYSSIKTTVTQTVHKTYPALTQFLSNIEQKYSVAKRLAFAKMLNNRLYPPEAGNVPILGYDLFRKTVDMVRNEPSAAAAAVSNNGEETQPPTTAATVAP